MLPSSDVPHDIPEDSYLTHGSRELKTIVASVNGRRKVMDGRGARLFRGLKIETTHPPGLTWCSPMTGDDDEALRAAAETPGGEGARSRR